MEEEQINTLNSFFRNMNYTYEEVKNSIGKYFYYHMKDTSPTIKLDYYGIRKIYYVSPDSYRYPIVIIKRSQRGDIAIDEVLHIFNEDNKLVKLLTKWE